MSSDCKHLRKISLSNKHVAKDFPDYSFCLDCGKVIGFPPEIHVPIGFIINVYQKTKIGFSFQCNREDLRK